MTSHTYYATIVGAFHRECNRNGRIAYELAGHRQATLQVRPIEPFLSR